MHRVVCPYCQKIFLKTIRWDDRDSEFLVCNNLLCRKTMKIKYENTSPVIYGERADCKNYGTESEHIWNNDQNKSCSVCYKLHPDVQIKLIEQLNGDS